jgi:penicillin-binding protein 1A
VAGVYLGFDQPRSLGPKATGGGLSAPIFRDFMVEALKDEPATPFRVPPGIRLVRVDYRTGERAGPGSEKVILEAFKPGTEPTGMQALIQGVTNYGQDAGYGSIIPLGTAGEGYQGGTMIIDSTGAYGTDPSGGGALTGTTSPDGSTTVDPSAITPTGPSSGTVQTQPPPQQPAVTPPGLNPPGIPQPGLQPQRPVGEIPLQPAPQPQPQPGAPAPDSSGGIY